MEKIFAQTLQIGTETINGVAKLPGQSSGNDMTVAGIVSAVVAFLLPLGGVALFGYLVWGGFEFLTSAGNPEKLKSGKERITAALIGFILLVLSYTLTRIVASIFGLEGNGIF